MIAKSIALYLCSSLMFLYENDHKTVSTTLLQMLLKYNLNVI